MLPPIEPPLDQAVEAQRRFRPGFDPDTGLVVGAVADGEALAIGGLQQAQGRVLVDRIVGYGDRTVRRGVAVGEQQGLVVPGLRDGEGELPAVKDASDDDAAVRPGRQLHRFGARRRGQSLVDGLFALGGGLSNRRSPGEHRPGRAEDEDGAKSGFQNRSMIRRSLINHVNALRSQLQLYPEHRRLGTGPSRSRRPGRQA